jgi:hypothetical protein
LVAQPKVGTSSEEYQYRGAGLWGVFEPWRQLARNLVRTMHCLRIAPVRAIRIQKLIFKSFAAVADNLSRPLFV